LCPLRDGAGLNGIRVHLISGISYLQNTTPSGALKTIK
jgi:hypothetical protein